MIWRGQEETGDRIVFVVLSGRLNANIVVRQREEGIWTIYPRRIMIGEDLYTAATQLSWAEETPPRR